MARDGANLHVLEGILISLILLGAAYAVRSIDTPATDAVRPRAELERLASDMLVVLDGLDDGNGTSLLDLYLTAAFHCAYDPVPSPLDCDGARAKNLSLKIDNYLPLGAGYALGVGNGIATRELYRSPLPQGEAVAASLTIGPAWNTTFAASEFSCYDAASDVHVTLVPIDRGAVSFAKWGNVTIGSTVTQGVRSGPTHWWDVTLPAATRPASTSFLANATGNATFPGASSYASCDLNGKAAALRTALLADTLTAGPAVVPLGSSTTFTAVLDDIAGVAGATIVGAEVVVYEPLAPRGHDPDSWIVAGTIPLTGGSTRTGTWTPAASTLFGAHPALLRVDVDVGTAIVELRKIAIVEVALPTGEVPVAHSYRVSLQAWLADWG